MPTHGIIIEELNKLITNAQTDSPEAPNSRLLLQEAHVIHRAYYPLATEVQEMIDAEPDYDVTLTAINVLLRTWYPLTEQMDDLIALEPMPAEILADLTAIYASLGIFFA